MKFATLKVRRKGIVILPKALREAAGISEGDELIADLHDGHIILKPFKPVRVKVDSTFVDRLLHEEAELEEKKFEEIAEGLKGCS